MSNSPGRREVAHRLFAAEYDDASLEYAESDEERAPNYVVTPTGARINRLFAVGVLTSVEQVNEDTVRARIADPTGAFVVYAGQYQPDELAALQSMEAPAFVAITGKTNTFEPEGSDRVLTSIRPESVTEVDAETRDRWVVTAAEHTLGRIETVADGLGREERSDQLVAVLRADGVAPGLAEGVARAIDHYGTTADYLGALRELSLQAVEVVAGDRSEADSLDVAPSEETGEYTVADLVDSAPPAATAVTEVAGDIEDVVIDDLDGDAGVDAGASAQSETGSEADTEPSTEETASESTETASETDTAVSEDAGADDAETSDDATTETTDEVATETTSDASGSEADETDSAAADTAADETDAAEEADEDADDSAAVETTETDEVSGVDDFDGGSSLGDDGEAADEDTEDVDETETTESPSDDAESTADDSESSSDEMYEVDEEERERIEEEYGVGFESGTEVGEPGEAGIEAPDPETVDESDAAAETDAADGTADATANAEPEEETTDADSEDASSGADETDDDADEADADLESVLLDQMEALDDGDGAERGDLVAAVVEETGADEDAVEDAIEDALMSGKCYEPSDGTYMPI